MIPNLLLLNRNQEDVASAANGGASINIIIDLRWISVTSSDYIRGYWMMSPSIHFYISRILAKLLIIVRRYCASVSKSFFTAICAITRRIPQF